jgi:hypothetical protein
MSIFFEVDSVVSRVNVLLIKSDMSNDKLLGKNTLSTILTPILCKVVLCRIVIALHQRTGSGAKFETNCFSGSTLRQLERASPAQPRVPAAGR